MNSKTDRRVTRNRLPTALLLVALSAGLATVGQAQEIPTLVVTTERPATISHFDQYRNAVRANAQEALWLTRISVGMDLSAKLARPTRKPRVAAKTDTSKRG